MTNSPLPNSKANSDGRIKVSTAGGSTGNDGKGDTDGEAPPDLKDGSEQCDAGGTIGVEVGGRHGGDAGEHVEKHSRGFGHGFAQDPGSTMLEVQPSLGDRRRRNHVAGDMALKGISISHLDVVRSLPGQVGWIVGGSHVEAGCVLNLPERDKKEEMGLEAVGLDVRRETLQKRHNSRNVNKASIR